MSTTNTPQAVPGDLIYLPPEFRGRVELNRRDMTTLFNLSRETLRLRVASGEMPAPLPASADLNYHRWSALAVNAFIAEQANASKSLTQNG